MATPDPPPRRKLTDDDRDLIKTARQIAPGLRASNSNRARLGGWLLTELADLAEHIAGEEADQ